VTDLLVYGAYGYTGELIAEAAAAREIALTVAGRDRTRVESVAGQLDCEGRVFGLDEPRVVEQVVGEHAVVLNCAGPFAETADPLVEACLAAGTQYLDVTGEISVFEALHDRDATARDCGVCLLPGVGFDVVPTDCLAAHLADRLGDADALELAFETDGSTSAGTLRTALRGLPDGGRVRRDGAIERVPLAHRTREVDFGNGLRTVGAIPWGDVATAYYTTGIPSVTVYQSMHPRTVRFLRIARYLSPVFRVDAVREAVLGLATDDYAGPDAAERETGSARIWGRATNGAGEQVVSRLRTPHPYALTVETAILAATRVLGGDAKPGFHTPAGLFGADVVLAVDGVRREDVQ
jgi:short subunit dehydrogenase-like uncharacterized protein